MKPDPENRVSFSFQSDPLLKLLFDIPGIAFTDAKNIQPLEQPVGDFGDRLLHAIRTAVNPPGWFGPLSQSASLPLIKQ